MTARPSSFGEFMQSPGWVEVGGSSFSCVPAMSPGGNAAGDGTGESGGSAQLPLSTDPAYPRLWEHDTQRATRRRRVSGADGSTQRGASIKRGWAPPVAEFVRIRSWH